MSKTYTLLDNLECESLSINGNYEGSSSFSANGKDITCKWVDISNNFEQSLSVLMGSGTWEAMAFYLDTLHGVVSIESETSTMRIIPSDVAGLSSQFTSLGGNSFNDIEVSEGAEVEMQTQATTFNSFKIGSGATIDLGGSQINIASLQAIGTSDSLISITGGTLSKPSGFVQCDYLNLTNSTATGGATWYAGSHSVDNGGNEGWIFDDPAPASSERSATISGLINTSSSRQASISGSKSADSVRSASISGVLMASNSRSAIISGFINTGANRNAIISGGTKTFGVRSAIISGSTLAFNIRNAIISGLMTGFGVRSAIISGSITLFNIRNATMQGLASSFVTRQASILGSIADTRMATIHGVMVTKFEDEVESTDTLSIVKRLHTLLSDNAQTSDILSITPVRTFSINGIIMPKPHELVTRRTEEGRVHDLLDGSHKWDVTSLYVSHQLTYKIANFNDPRWQELYTMYEEHLKNGDEEGMYVIWDEKFIAGYYYVDISPVDYIRGAGNLATFRLVLTEIL